MDAGDMTIKRFDPNGHYVAAYGGRGEGPGEFNIFSDMGLVDDSILYVTDPNNHRISFFAVESGAFVHSVSNIQAVRYRVTPEGRAFWPELVSTKTDSLFATIKGTETRQFGTLLDDQSMFSKILLAGRIVTYGERMIYVPSRFPIIMQYDSTGSVVYARSTPDLGRVEVPVVNTEGLSGGFATGIRGSNIQGTSAVYGDRLVIYAFVGQSTKAFDIYDADTGDYQSSISLPWGRSTPIALYNPALDRIWQVQDTLVTVYAVER